MRRAGHRVGGLAAARCAAPGQIQRRAAPGEFALLPGHTQDFGHHALTVAPRLRPVIADSGKDGELAVGFNDEQPVVADGAAHECAHGHADSAHLGPALLGLRLPLLPLEFFDAPIQRFLHEATGGVGALASRRHRPELGLALGSVDPPNGYLVDAELARGLGQDRLHERDPLHAAGGALRGARRSVRQHYESPPAHRRDLVQQRDHGGRRAAIAGWLVRATVTDHEHIQRRDLTFLGKANLHPAEQAGTRAADVMLLLAADAQHDRSVGLLRQ